MATEDLNDVPPPPSSDLEQTPLPDYSQLILEAIEALNEPEGSSISAISKQIESTHSDLPDSFPTLLSYHVNKMKQIGELTMVDDNYMKSAPNAPPKRGRGRPPKSKEPLPPVMVSSSPRPRGRPPKAKDPSAPPPEPKSPTGTGRPRGRPSKKPKTDSVDAAPAAAPAPGIKRGRGRPPKVKPAVAAVGC